MPTGVNSILHVDVPVSVSLGTRTMAIGDIRRLTSGSIIELSKHVQDELDVLVDQKRIGRGKAVQIGENLGIRLTQVSDRRRHSVGALAGQES